MGPCRDQALLCKRCREPECPRAAIHRIVVREKEKYLAFLTRQIMIRVHKRRREVQRVKRLYRDRERAHRSSLYLMRHCKKRYPLDDRSKSVVCHKEPVIVQIPVQAVSMENPHTLDFKQLARNHRLESEDVPYRDISEQDMAKHYG